MVDLVVGTTTGLIKHVSIAKDGKVAAQPYGYQSREHSVSGLEWGVDGCIVVARKSGLVEAIDLDTGANPFSLNYDSPLVAAFPLKSVDGVLAVSETTAAVKRWTDESEEVVKSISVKGPIEAARLSSDECRLAVGGKENELQVHDIESGSVVFTAKNVKRNHLDLRMPVWVKDIALFGGDTQRMAIGTSYGQVRIYDVSQQRRPVCNWLIDEEDPKPINCVALLPDETKLIFADTMGTMRMIDTRTGRTLGGFKGIGGSVRAIAVHPTLPFAAGVGRDRFLNVYNTVTCKRVFKVYLKQQLNAVVFREVVDEADEEDEEGEGGTAGDTTMDDANESENESDDGLWGGMVVAAGDDVAPEDIESQAGVSKKRKRASDGGDSEEESEGESEAAEEESESVRKSKRKRRGK